jgi:hypothetical protein
LCCYCRKRHFENQWQHTLGSQTFFIFIDHRDSSFLKTSAKVQEFPLGPKVMVAAFTGNRDLIPYTLSVTFP